MEDRQDAATVSTDSEYRIWLYDALTRLKIELLRWDVQDALQEKGVEARNATRVLRALQDIVAML